MKSKVKFVSAVGVRLLTSFRTCLWFSLSSRSYCLTLVGRWGGSPLLVVKPACQGLRIFPGSWRLGGGEEGWAQFALNGGSVWATIITGAHFPAHYLKALCGHTHHSVQLCGLAPTNHLTLHPFDQSARCTEWEQTTGTLLPP